MPAAISSPGPAITGASPRAPRKGSVTRLPGTRKTGQRGGQSVGTRARGRKACSNGMAVVADSALVALPDDQILAHAATTARAVVTASTKDFMPLDTGW